MAHTRLLITGASGNLGYALSRLAQSQYEVLGTYFRQAKIGGGRPVQIDLTDRSQVDNLFALFQPHAVIHTAGSDRSPNMFRTILEGSRNVAAAAASQQCRLIAMSTDVIFDGTQAPYPESALPSPVHEYGQAKAQAETIIQRIHPDAVIVRTSLIYDFVRSNRQLGWMMDLIERGKKLQLFVDEFRQPIWSRNLAEALIELVETDYRGVLNIAGGERLSRCDIGRQLLKAVGIEADSVIVPAHVADVTPERPRDCTLVLERAKALLRTRLLTLGEARHSWVHHSSDHPTSTTTSR